MGRTITANFDVSAMQRIYIVTLMMLPCLIVSSLFVFGSLLTNIRVCFFFFVSCFFLRLYLLILKCREREWRGSLWFFGDEEKNKLHRLYCPWCGQLDPSASRFRVFLFFSIRFLSHEKEGDRMGTTTRRPFFL